MKLLKYTDIDEKLSEKEEQKKIQDEEEFLTAILLSDFAKVKYYINKGVNVNARSKHVESALRRFCAVDKHLYNKDIIEFLVEHGADVNIRDEDGITPSMWAAIKNNPKLLKYLLENGADFTLKDNRGRDVKYWGKNFRDVMEIAQDPVAYRLRNKLEPTITKVHKNSGIF